jgi:hypothetical protein
VSKDASKDNLKRVMIRIRTEGITNPLPIIHSNSIQWMRLRVGGMPKEYGITGILVTCQAFSNLLYEH